MPLRQHPRNQPNKSPEAGSPEAREPPQKKGRSLWLFVLRKGSENMSEFEKYGFVEKQLEVNDGELSLINK